MLSDVQTLVMKRKAISEVPPAAISSSPLLYIFTSTTAEKGTKHGNVLCRQVHNNNYNKINKAVMVFNLKPVNSNLNL